MALEKKLHVDLDNLDGVAKEFPPFVLDRERDQTKKEPSRLKRFILDKLKLVAIAIPISYGLFVTGYSVIECKRSEQKLPLHHGIMFRERVLSASEDNLKNRRRIANEGIQNLIKESQIPEEIRKVKFYLTPTTKQARYNPRTNTITLSFPFETQELIHEFGEKAYCSLTDSQRRTFERLAKQYSEMWAKEYKNVKGRPPKSQEALEFRGFSLLEDHSDEKGNFYDKTLDRHEFFADAFKKMHRPAIEGNAEVVSRTRTYQYTLTGHRRFCEHFKPFFDEVYATPIKKDRELDLTLILGLRDFFPALINNHNRFSQGMLEI